MEGHVGFVQHPGECFNDKITSALRTADPEALSECSKCCQGCRVMRPSKYASAFQNNNLRL